MFAVEPQVKFETLVAGFLVILPWHLFTRITGAAFVAIWPTLVQVAFQEMVDD